ASRGRSYHTGGAAARGSACTAGAPAALRGRARGRPGDDRDSARQRIAAECRAAGVPCRVHPYEMEALRAESLTTMHPDTREPDAVNPHATVWRPLHVSSDPRDSPSRLSW